MADCSDSVQKRGTSNPIQSKIVENDHGSGGSSTGDNTISGATCDASVAVGNVVRMNGGTAVNALADSLTNSRIIGICVSKASATECDIQVTGFTDTGVLSGLSINTDYFLSETTPGAITTTPPSGSGNTVTFIGRAYATNQLVINIGIPLIRA